ncbi:MAG: flagellar hook-basal body complex protein FliE [Acidimicrobiales bacterium]|jgi:flagellar hook-basal body complex protein FliE
MSIIPVSAASGALFPAADSSAVGTAGIAGPTAPTTPTAPLGGPDGAAGAGGNSFANVLGNAIDGMQSAQANADNLATQAATGSLTNVSDYMVAADEANIQTQLTAAVRNNALQAFQQIMGMQL